MARNLAHNAESGKSPSSGDELPIEADKGLLKRREYVQLGATAAAAAVGVSNLSGITSGEEDTTSAFTTDFSEYLQ